MGDGFGGLATLRVGHGQHVERVVVVGVLIAHQPQMGDGFVVPAAVDRQRGGVQPFINGLGSLLSGTRLPLADVQVQANAFVELLLVGVLSEDRLEQVSRLTVIVSLQSFQSPFVEGDSIDVG